jgi:CubicO group peptidase (beta-lactamase class C family)
MLALAEQGKFDLEAPVEKYLPLFGKLKMADGSPARSPKVWEVLCHRAGFFSQKEKMTRVQQQLIRTYDRTLQQTVDGIGAQPLIAAPGERFAYSGAGYCVAGRAAEAATSTPFDKLLHVKLADPLGMKRTTYFPAPTEPNIAVGVVEENSKTAADSETPHMLHDKLRLALIGGSLYTTAHDLGLFGAMVLSGGKANGKPVLGAAMFKRYTSRILPGEKYGFGWGVKVNPSGQTTDLSHSGALASSRALLHIDLAGGKYGVIVYTLGPKNREATMAKINKIMNGAMGSAGSEMP